MDLNEVIDTAFDLNYLGLKEFPETEFRSVCILGGGTAGYLSALALKKAHPYLKLQLIESSKIPVIGVGESTTTEIIPFLHSFLGIDPVDFYKEVKPSFKLGIKFDWGRKEEKPFHFNFFAGHLYENLCYENHTGSFNWPADLMYQEKLPVISTGDGGFHSFLNSIPFSYHIDNKSFIQFLRKQIKKLGIEIVDTEILSSQKDNSGNILSLIDSEEKKISADFFIDCSGFRSSLLEKEMKEDFISFSDSLFCDTAISFNLPNSGKPSPYTEAITMNSGWCWRIPIREEDHYGYVYSSDFLSKEEALKEIEEKFGAIKKHKVIPFRSGRHKRALVKNLYAIGNSYAFIEPLESTAIQTLIQSIMLLCRLFPKNLEDTSSAEAINKEVAESWESFRAFLAIHYKFNHKLDTPFWKKARNEVSLGRAEKILKLYDQKSPLSYSHFGNSSSYTALESLVFNSYSYDSLLMGQGVFPKNRSEPRFSKAELENKIESYKKLSEVSFSQKELFDNEELFIEGIWKPLFESEDSWVLETMV